MIRALAFLVSVAAWAAPCTTATANCSEWVALAGENAQALVYRTYPLEAADARVTRALVLVHGQGRNANDYFRTAVAAAFLAGALENTLVIAPRFSSDDGGCNDKLSPNEVNWPCAGDSWRSGADAINRPGLTSYDFADTILRKLARRETFPNLKSIVVAGHSAGGQYVARYAMANRVHEKLGVPVTYVVANPSSYAYPDASRPDGDGGFGPYPDARHCTAYDRWPFGLQNRTGYAAALPAAELIRQLASRPVVYMLGELDTLPLAGFDSSCPAMAQGPNRRARGEAFRNHINARYGARHGLLIVPMCGHNARCMFTADESLAVLFP